MGSWAVLSAWNDSGNGFHDWHARGEGYPGDQGPKDRPWTAGEVIDFFCFPVVEQHQRWGKPEEGDVPEFVIEVAYKNRDQHGNPVSEGYRYVLKWLENGQFRQAREYGYATEADAIRSARANADRVARSLAPVHVETYRPEI
jgi:hypothetical protein